jgi:hypothetical protein
MLSECSALRAGFVRESLFLSPPLSDLQMVPSLWGPAASRALLTSMQKDEKVCEVQGGENGRGVTI